MRSRLAALWGAVRRKRHESIALSALLALDLAVAITVMLPLQPHVAAIEARAAQLEAQADQARKDRDELRARAKQVSASLRACARFRNDVAGTKEERYLVFKRALETVVGLGPSGATSIGFRSSRSPAGFHLQGAELTIEGTYPRLRQVLSQLMASPSFLIIDRVTLRSSVGRPPQAALSISTVFTASRTPEPTDPLGEIDGAGEAPKSPPAAPAKTPLVAPRASISPSGGAEDHG